MTSRTKNEREIKSSKLYSVVIEMHQEGTLGGEGCFIKTENYETLLMNTTLLKKDRLQH